MESLCNILILLFKDISSKEILHNRIRYNAFDMKAFLELAQIHMTQYSGNDVRNLYYYLRDEVKEIGTDGQKETQHVNVMNVLRKFNDLVLKETEGIPVCRYRYLLNWRMVSFKLEEELFTTSCLAWRDTKKHRGMRTDFGWKYIIGNDNVELNNILNRGLVDNHFHLKGSAPYFYMSWINLMNQVDNAEFIKNLRKYDRNRLDRMELYHSEAAEERLVILQLQAALIRVYLYTWLTDRTFWLQEDNYTAFANVREMMDWSDFDDQINIAEKLQAVYDRQNATGEYGRAFADRIVFLFFMSEDVTGKKKRKVEWICRNIIRDMKMEELHLESERAGITEKMLIYKCFTVGRQINLNREFVGLFVRCGERKEIERRISLNIVESMVNDPPILEWSREKLQGLLENLRSEGRHPYDKQVLDYMQNHSAEGSDDLYGERWFLYMMFRKIYEGNTEAARRGNLFYGYLVIKERIRAELIQVNDRVGFDNFLRYQNRKEEFIDNTPLSRVYSRHAVVSSFNGQPLRMLEARIVPRATASENRKYIKKLDEEILKKEEKGNLKFIDGQRLSEKDFFYVFHFVKEQEKEEINTYECRHYKLRNGVKKQALGIYCLRERYEKEASRVYGIDACSPEIGCRPEVFAQAFRFLKNEQNYLNGADSEYRRPRLWTTYHVGEDFLDIVDGMRAIDEAIYFLNMTHGDRLGHALALGVSPQEWYAFKRGRVLCCKQDILDNIVWIHQKIRKYNIKDTESILMKLKRNFVHFYQDIYKTGPWRNEEDGDIDLYYDAWKLRGDNPELYYRDTVDWNQREGLSVWDAYGRNTKYEELDIIRKEPRCVRLYHRYHYDMAVRKAGNIVVEYKVDRDIVDVVQKIQYHLQREILEKGLAIEANPSSNYSIGTFRAYDKHPILAWYNKGLTNDREKLDRCPQLDVTINTDDQAVFGTSLENEFALMAVALEKAADEKGNLIYKKDMIYGWLNEIRKKGSTRSFRQLKGETRIEEGNS